MRHDTASIALCISLIVCRLVASLRVASFNTYYGFFGDIYQQNGSRHGVNRNNPSDWVQHANFLAHSIQSLGADVVGLQEIDGIAVAQHIAAVLNFWDSRMMCPNLGNATSAHASVSCPYGEAYTSWRRPARWYQHEWNAIVAPSHNRQGMTVGLLSRLPVINAWQSVEQVKLPLEGSACGIWLPEDEREAVARSPGAWKGVRAQLQRKRRRALRDIPTQGLARHLFVRVQLPSDSSEDAPDARSLVVAVAHLKAFPHEARSCARREGQALVLRRAVERVCAEEGGEMGACPVVVLGDMNDLDDGTGAEGSGRWSSAGAGAGSAGNGTAAGGAESVEVDASGESRALQSANAKLSAPTTHQRLLHALHPAARASNTVGVGSAGRPARDMLSMQRVGVLDAWGNLPSSRAMRVLRMGQAALVDLDELPGSIPSESSGPRSVTPQGRQEEDKARDEREYEQMRRGKQGGRRRDRAGPVRGRTSLRLACDVSAGASDGGPASQHQDNDVRLLGRAASERGTACSELSVAGTVDGGAARQTPSVLASVRQTAAGSVVAVVRGGRRQAAGERDTGHEDSGAAGHGGPLRLVSTAQLLVQSDRWSWAPMSPGSMQFGVSLFDHVLVSDGLRRTGAVLGAGIERLGGEWPPHLQLLGRMVWACTEATGEWKHAAVGCGAVASWEALDGQMGYMLQMQQRQSNLMQANKAYNRQSSDPNVTPTEKTDPWEEVVGVRLGGAGITAHVGGVYLHATKHAMDALQQAARCMAGQHALHAGSWNEGAAGWTSDSLAAPISFVRDVAGRLALAKDSPLPAVGAVPEALLRSGGSCDVVEVSPRVSDHAPVWVDLRM